MEKEIQRNTLGVMRDTKCSTGSGGDEKCCLTGSLEGLTAHVLLGDALNNRKTKDSA